MPASDIIRLTVDDVQESMGCDRETALAWADPLSGAAVLYGINTPKRMAPWLATIAHESAGLTRLEEDLRYSAKGLAKNWPQHFMGDNGPNELAQKLAREGPEAIANYVYDDANRGPRAKLGNVNSGDGWAFIGRGPGQLTGRDNYTRFKEASGIDVVRFPDLLLEPPVGAMSVGWIWNDKGLNQLADEDRFEDIVRRYNGGLIGYEDRLEKLQLAQNVLEGHA